MVKKLDDLVSEMRNFGEQLINYNFPKADPQLEDDLNILKSKEVVVDGYSLILHFSKADYKNHYVEVLQIIGKYFPFLPFDLVVKIGRKFLGSDHLYLVEILKDNQKIYCWTVALDRRGRPILSPHQHDAQILKFEDFSYSYLDPSQINTY